MKIMCSSCEFYFPANEEKTKFRCAGGSRFVDGKQEEGYFKKYGDEIKKGDEKIRHNCYAWGESLEHFISRNKRK